MRTFAQDAAFYRKVRVDGTDDPEALRRLKELEAIDAIQRRFTLAEALSALGWGGARTTSASGGCGMRARRGWFRAAAARRATPGGSGRRRWRCGGRRPSPPAHRPSPLPASTASRTPHTSSASAPPSPRPNSASRELTAGTLSAGSSRCCVNPKSDLPLAVLRLLRCVLNVLADSIGCPWSQNDGTGPTPSPCAPCTRAGAVRRVRLGRGSVHSLGCAGRGGHFRWPAASGCRCRERLAGAGGPAAALPNDSQGGGAGFRAPVAERRPRRGVRGGRGAHELHPVGLLAVRSPGRRRRQRGDVRGGRGSARGYGLDAWGGLRAGANGG